MSPGVTIILGAGAPLNFSLPSNLIWPSTAKITDEVRKPYRDHTQWNTNRDARTDIADQFYHILKQKYPSTKGAGRNINFEQLFHCMEMYFSYCYSWKNDCLNEDICPVFGPFTAPSVIYDSSVISSAMKEFLMRVMDIVDGYDLYFKSEMDGVESWYRDFFRNLPLRPDIFNFNYDNTLEHVYGDGGYEDGFVDMGDSYKIFSPKQLNYNPADLPTINHLHGAINYYHTIGGNDYLGMLRHEDWVKYQDYAQVRKMMIGRSQSQPRTQSGETIFNGPIITGLNKTAKLNCVPFDFYHNNLVQSIIRNNALLIVGYSFGDSYCNQLIQRMNMIHGNRARVCIIDYRPMRTNSRHEFHQWVYDGYEGASGGGMSRAMGETLCYYSDTTDFCQALDSLQPCDPNKLMISPNGKLMLGINGFKRAVTQSADIYSFLQS